MANNRYPFEQDHYYHVYNRGYMKRNIFHKESDYRKFISYVDEILPEYPTLKLYIYCLLPNHFHFIFQQTNEGFDISECMRRIQVSYANYYKAKYKKKRGIPMFEGRFRAKHLDNEEYLLECYKYIQYNPLKHQLVDFIDKRPYLFPLRPVARA